MNAIKKISTIFLLFITTISFSQNIVTDRPDQTESSSIVPLKSLQIEAGLLFLNSNGVQFNALPSILWRYGVTEKFELRLLTQYESSKIINNSLKNNGISDIQIGAKIQVFKKENVNTQIAFLSHLVLPTAKRELTIDKIGSINRLAISHSISEKIGVGYNFGYDYFGTGSGNLTYTLSFGVSLIEKLSLYLESYGQFTEFNTHMASFDTGFTYLVSNKVQLDISYGTGLNYGMNYFSTGVSWNINKNK